MRFDDWRDALWCSGDREFQGWRICHWYHRHHWNYESIFLFQNIHVKYICFSKFSLLPTALCSQIYVLIFCRTYKFKKKLPLYICQEENRLREFFNFFASLNLWKVTFMNFPFFYMPSYVQKSYWVGLLPGIPLWNSSQISQKYPWKPSDNPPWIPSIDSFWNSYRNVIRYIFLQKSLQ